MASAGRLILIAFLLLLGLEGVTLMPVRARLMLSVYAGVFAVLTFARRRIVLEQPLRRPAAVAFVLSVLPVIAAGFLGYEDPLRAVVEELQPTLVGWSVFLVLLPLVGEDRPGQPITAASDWRPSPIAVPAFVIAALVMLAVSHYLAAGRAAIISDEAVYLTQSRWMVFPQLTWTVDADIAPFFRMRKVDYLDGHLYGMYPPGWPALLAVFRYAGLEWWASVVLGTISAVLLYVLGRRLHSARMGALAAVLLVTSQFYLMSHAGYMAHAATIAALLAATWCMVDGIELSGWRRATRWFLAGALLGYVVTVRPLTGISIGASIGAWMMLRAWQVDRRSPWLLAVLVAAGGILPAALLITYNSLVLGSPLALGYQVMHPGMYDLGFGPRGFRVLDANLVWTPLTFDHTPYDALRMLTRRLVGMNTTFLPVGMLAPIAALAVAAGYRIPWSRVALFGVLPVTHFFYWYGGLRLYTELLPFLFLGTATMLLALHARWPRIAVAMTVMVLASQAVVALPWPPASGGGHRPWSVSDYVRRAQGRRATLLIADSLARTQGRLLLFSRERTHFDNQMDRLYQHNGNRFDGHILVARDRGALNIELMRRFPDRIPYLVEDQGEVQAATFTRIAPE